MSSRTRTSWAALAASNKDASAPPANPNNDTTDGGSDHPAAQPDYVDKPSNMDLADDPTTGPYPNSPAPAIPGNDTTETADHPAKVASQFELRVAAENKADLCCKIAEAILPEGTSDDEITKKAVSLMYEDDASIAATYATLVKSGAVKADDDEDDDEDEDDDNGDDDNGEADVEGSKGKKSAQVLALEAEVAALKKAVYAMPGMADYYDDPGMNDGVNDPMNEEALLAQMEMEMEGDEYMDEEALLAQMEQEMGMNAPPTPEVMGDDDMDPGLMAFFASDDEDKDASDDEDKDAQDEDNGSDKEASDPLAEANIQVTADDAMGLNGQPKISNDDVVAALFGEQFTNRAAKKAEDDEDEDQDEEANADQDKEASQRAPRPQARTASTGATSIGGGVQGSPAGSNKVKELEKLWGAPAPDVSAAYDLKR